MVTSPYVWNILEWDELPKKHQTKKAYKQTKQTCIYIFL